MMEDTLKLAKVATLIQQLLDSVGQTFPGQAFLKQIKISPSNYITDITLIVSCVRNSGMAPTMVESPLPSPANPSSPSTSSRISNPNTSKLSLPIYRGRSGWIINSVDMDTLLASLDASDGSSEGDQINLFFEKQSLTILKVPSPT